MEAASSPVEASAASVSAFFTVRPPLRTQVRGNPGDGVKRLPEPVRGGKYASPREPGRRPASGAGRGFFRPVKTTVRRKPQARSRSRFRLPEHRPALRHGRWHQRASGRPLRSFPPGHGRDECSVAPGRHRQCGNPQCFDQSLDHFGVRDRPMGCGSERRFHAARLVAREFAAVLKGA
jgi:hypothetical protein